MREIIRLPRCQQSNLERYHNDVIMGATASQITSLTIVYSIIYSDADHSPGTGEFPAQMASYVENVSIWWLHHGIILGTYSKNNQYLGQVRNKGIYQETWYWHNLYKIVCYMHEKDKNFFKESLPEALQYPWIYCIIKPFSETHIEGFFFFLIKLLYFCLISKLWQEADICLWRYFLGLFVV